MVKQKRVTYDQQFNILSQPFTNNRLSIVGSEYFAKTFLNENNLTRDIVGTHLFNQLADSGPIVIGNISNQCFTQNLINYIEVSTALKNKFITRRQIEHVIASFVAQVFCGYRLRGEIINGLIPNNLRWVNKKNEVLSEFIRHSSQLDEYMPISIKRQIIRTLKQISKSEQRNITLLHRDIHIGNIMFCNNFNDTTDFKIIDFEHFMEGPIELEFQNSILWNDKCSIDYKSIIEILKSHYYVPYDLQQQNLMVDFYFADQINIAVASNDNSKISLLVRKYKNVENK